MANLQAGIQISSLERMKKSRLGLGRKRGKEQLYTVPVVFFGNAGRKSVIRFSFNMLHVSVQDLFEMLDQGVVFFDKGRKLTQDLASYELRNLFPDFEKN